MVRRGRRTKTENVEKAILDLLVTSNARLHGLGFREIHRKLQTEPEARKAGSFSTLKTCLRNLALQGVVRRDPENHKYFIDLCELFAREKREVMMKTISESNIFGGGQLFYPKLEEILLAPTKPKERPRIFGANCAFFKASLKGTLGFKDEGFLTLETFDGRWSDDPPALKPDSRWITKETRTRAARAPKSPPYLELTMSHAHKLNVARTMEDWLRTIWKYAKQNHLVRNDLTPEEITNEELESLWWRMFKGVEGIVHAEFIDPQKLLEWLKTSEGKNRFVKTLKTTNRTGQARMTKDSQ